MHGEMRGKTGGRTRRNLAIVVVLLAVAAASYYVFTSSTPQPPRGGRFAGNGGPVPVLAANAARADVPVYLDAVGTVRALNTVTVRPQVEGKLIEVAFKEGQDVKKGDLLARIDPATYQAAYDQAVAKKAQDEALLANAKNDLDRYEKLATSNAINRQQVDTQKALVAQYTAQVKADQAAIEAAKATLDYTVIRSPIDGRTGLRQVDEGNIVRASDANGIVVLTQIQPISVLFSLPQQDIHQVNAAFAKGPLATDAMRSDTGEVIDHGKLVVVDNQVDASTGTVRMKADFPNAELKLWPGQFVNVRLLINTLQQVVVIPTGAVQRGPNGTFVYVVQTDGSAVVRSIEVLKQDETQTVVASGLTPPERVVTTGFARLTDGAKVSVGSGDGAPAAQPQRTRPVAGARPGGQIGERQRGGNTTGSNATQ